MNNHAKRREVLALYADQARVAKGSPEGGRFGKGGGGEKKDYGTYKGRRMPQDQFKKLVINKLGKKVGKAVAKYTERRSDDLDMVKVWDELSAKKPDTLEGALAIIGDIRQAGVSKRVEGERGKV